MLVPNSFDADPRRQQELRLRPAAAAIYRHLLGRSIWIEYTDGNDLDRKLGIDGKLILHTGQVLTFQEKFLSAKYAAYQTLTIELDQDASQPSGEGDWHSCAAQVYFCGYESARGGDFQSWVLVDYPRLVLQTALGQIQWGTRRNQDGHARASFAYTLIKDLPASVILANHLTAKPN